MNSLTCSNVMEEIKQIEFSKLRHAYITVKSFIENESADDFIRPNSKEKALFF
jgi:hypothetical protein